MLGEVLNAVGDIPRRLSSDEQGAFILGYQQQTQKRYEKKLDKEDE